MTLYRQCALALTLGLLPLPGLATPGIGPLTACEVGVEVIVAGGTPQPGVIEADAAGMCIVRLPDGDMTVAPVEILTRASDAGGAGEMVALGTYACTDPQGVADGFPVEITEGGTYRDQYGISGTWLRHSADVISFTQGPLNSAQAQLDGTGLILSGPNLFTTFTCAPQG